MILEVLMRSITISKIAGAYRFHPLQFFIGRGRLQKRMNYSDVISDNHTTRTTTNKIPAFFRGLVDYPGQGGLDGNRSTSEEINGT